MNRFRSAIFGFGQFCAIVLVVFSTITGGIVGHHIFDVINRPANGSAIPAFMQKLDPGLFGTGAGAITGFLVSMCFAAILFGIVEIARNTSDRWFP